MYCLDKPIHLWSEEDLFVLLEHPESITLEFKDQVPSKNIVSEWNDRKELVSYAKHKLIKEIIALANTCGGLLLIGIVENKEVGGKHSISGIPYPLEFANKFMQSLSDSVDPALDCVQHKVIVTSRDLGCVVIRVNRSMAAPHRYNNDNEYYVRRDSHCRRMSAAEVAEYIRNVHRHAVDGLWKTEIYGRAFVLLLDNGRVFGGDSEYYYYGRYDVVGNGIVGHLNIVQHKAGARSIFGQSGNLFLWIEGDHDAATINARIIRSNVPFPGDGIRLEKIKDSMW